MVRRSRFPSRQYAISRCSAVQGSHEFALVKAGHGGQINEGRASVDTRELPYVVVAGLELAVP